MDTRILHVRRALLVLPAAAALTLSGAALSASAAPASSASAATASSASAAPTSTGGTKTVVWSVPGGLGDRFAEPQRLASDTSGCGDFQVDTYRYDSPSSIAFVDALVDRGTLTNAGEDGAVFIGNRDVSNTCDASGRIIATSGSDGAATVSSSGSGGTAAGTAASSPSGDTGILAFTGSDDQTVAALAAGGLVAVAAGLVVFGIRRFVVEGR